MNKIFFGPNFFHIPFLLDLSFFDAKFFWTPNFSGPKFFSDPKFFQAKNLFWSITIDIFPFAEISKINIFNYHGLQMDGSSCKYKIRKIQGVFLGDKASLGLVVSKLLTKKFERACIRFCWGYTSASVGQQKLKKSCSRCFLWFSFRILSPLKKKYVSQMWILVKSTNRQYLGLEAKTDKNKGTLFSAT